MLRVHATSRILDSVLRNARSRLPFRQPTTAAGLALLPAAREPLLVVRSVGGCESRPPSRRCRVLLIARSLWNSELRVSSTHNFCRARNSLAFRVPIRTPKSSAVSPDSVSTPLSHHQGSKISGKHVLCAFVVAFCLAASLLWAFVRYWLFGL